MHSRPSSPNLFISLYLASLGAVLVVIVLKLAISIALSSGLPGDPNLSTLTLLFAALVGLGDVFIGVELFRAWKNRMGFGERRIDDEDQP